MERKMDGFENQKTIILPDEIEKIQMSIPFTRQLFVTDIGFYPEALGHYRERKLGANEHIFIYCYKGKGYYSLEGEKKNSVAKDQFVIIKAGTSHLYFSSQSQPWSIYWIHFRGDNSLLFEEIFNKTHDINKRTQSLFSDRILLFQEIFTTLEMGYSFENLKYASACLWHLLGSLSFSPNMLGSEVVDNQQTIVDNAILFMKSNIEKRLSLKDFADAVCYSPSHFGSIFSQKTGFTPVEYFNQLKIQKACQYLEQTTLSIKDIAGKLDYYDQYYFAKTFDKYQGITPAKYRQLLTQKKP